MKQHLGLGLVAVAAAGVVALATVGGGLLTGEESSPRSQWAAAVSGPDVSGGETADGDADGLFAGTTFAGPVVVAVGDIACDPDEPVPNDRSCREAETAALTERIDPRLVLGLGDMQYQRGSYEDFMLAYDRTWGDLRPITRPVPGNHEYRVRGGRGYFRYFRDQQPGPPGYYTFTVGRWRVFALNTNCDKVDCARERRWLARQMRRDSHRCTLMTMHHPRYSSGGEHGSSTVPARFWRTALRDRTELALAGHDHDYERFRPMDADGHVTSSGIQSFVAGAGGKSLYGFGRVRRGSVVRHNDAPGVLVLKLGRDRYAWEYRAVGQGLVDSGTRRCR